MSVARDSFSFSLTFGREEGRCGVVHCQYEIPFAHKLSCISNIFCNNFIFFCLLMHHVA